MSTATGQFAYDTTDAVQQQFLSALKLGETGVNPNAYNIGYGGADLSGAKTDQFGFPIWAGLDNSHAAGAYQFEPATWDSLAQTYGLNFADPTNQDEGAWLYAQQYFAQHTGGASLEQALQSGNYNQVQSVLSPIWPSVTGNAAAPGGISTSLTTGAGASLASSPTDAGSGSGATGGTGSVVGTVEDFFVRFGLIIIGGIILIVALWQLLSNQGIVPSPADTAKIAATAL